MKRNNHYVPVFYLKNFTTKSGKRYLAGVMDKIKNEKYIDDVYGFGCEKDFYIVKENGVKTDKYEDWLNTLYEGKLSIKYQNIIDKYSKIKPLPTPFNKKTSIESSISPDIITCEEKEILSYFISFLSIRGKHTRNAITDFYKQITNILEEFHKVDTKFLKQEITKSATDEICNDSAKNTHIKSIFDETIKNRIVNILKEQIWYIGINNTENDIYTSDVGYAMNVSDTEYPKSRGVGFGSYSLEYVLPLTPKICLFIHERKYMESLVEGPLSILENKVIELKYENIVRINDMIIKNSERKIISQNSKWEIYEELADSLI